MQVNCLTIGKAILMQSQYRKYMCAGYRRYGKGGCGLINIPSVPFDEFILKRVELGQLRGVNRPVQARGGAVELRKYHGMNNFHEEREKASIGVN